MTKIKREQSVEFVCIGTCEDPPVWLVEGRFDPEGRFEPRAFFEEESDLYCPECGERGEPTDYDVAVVDLP